MVDKANHAIARFTEKMETESEKVTGAETHIAAIKASSNWGAAAAVQTATNNWAAGTAVLDAENMSIAALEKALGVARTNQLANLRRWTLQRQGVLNAINIFCDGSRDTMLTFGVAINEPVPHEPASTPVGVTPRKEKVSFEVAWQWFLTPPNRYGFMVQHATNVADATTYSQPMACSKRSFKLLAQTPATTISFRVMSLESGAADGADRLVDVGVLRGPRLRAWHSAPLPAGRTTCRERAVRQEASGPASPASPTLPGPASTAIGHCGSGPPGS